MRIKLRIVEAAHAPGIHVLTIETKGSEDKFIRTTHSIITLDEIEGFELELTNLVSKLYEYRKQKEEVLCEI